ncbi:hypothetical protein CR513_59448, partial [Mucuna pruriens]
PNPEEEAKVITLRSEKELNELKKKNKHASLQKEKVFTEEIPTKEKEKGKEKLHINISFAKVIAQMSNKLGLQEPHPTNISLTITHSLGLVEDVLVKVDNPNHFRKTLLDHREGCDRCRVRKIDLKIRVGLLSNVKLSLEG